MVQTEVTDTEHAAVMEKTLVMDKKTKELDAHTGKVCHLFSPLHRCADQNE